MDDRVSRYEPLRRYLEKKAASEVRMTFPEIEKVLGFRLPAASENHRAGWSNNPDNNVMTKEWLAAGYKTEQVDMKGRKLVFRRTSPMPATDRPTEQSQSASTDLKPRRHPGFGLMKGLTTIAPGTDLTAPSGDAWGQED